MAKKNELFMEDYLFTGSHEEKARKLTSEIDNSSGAKLFSSAVELYMVAAIIGVYYKKRSPKDKGNQTLRIHQGQFTNHYEKLMFIYKLVMLNNSDLRLEAIDKINNAFRYRENDDNIKIFEEYMLGGVDILYDKLFVSTNSSYEDFLISLNSLLSEFKNEDIEDDINFDDEIDI